MRNKKSDNVDLGLWKTKPMSRASQKLFLASKLKSPLKITFSTIVIHDVWQLEVVFIYSKALPQLQLSATPRAHVNDDKEFCRGVFKSIYHTDVKVEDF